MTPPKLLKIPNSQVEPKVTDCIINKNKFMKSLLTQGKNLIKANKILRNSKATFNAIKDKNKC